MAFDVNKMYVACCKLIDQFQLKHDNETFYGFAIQFGGLHLNSLEQYERTIKFYQERFPNQYNDPKSQERLKWSIGDWGYKHFISLDEVEGYDQDLFDEYYQLCFDNNDPKVAMSTDYYKAMKELLNLVLNSDCLTKLKKTSDFKSYFIAADD